MTVSTGTKTGENLKQENYRSNINNTCVVCVHPKNYQKMPKMYQNLDLNYLKTVNKMLRLEIFLTFDNTFAANILGMWEKRRGLPPLLLMWGCSSLVSWCHNTVVRSFLKNW